MTMQRARRLATAAVVASLAVTGLSACRSEPTVAAYVGQDVRITEARVQRVWNEAQAAVTATPAQDGKPAQLRITRSDVVRTLLAVPILDEVAKRQSVTLPPQIDSSEAVATTGVPAKAEFTQLYAHADTLVKLLRQQAQNAPEPTEADLRSVYDALVAAGEAQPGSFDSFKSSLPPQNAALLRSSTAVRNEITQVADPMDIRVNPRYQPLAISVLDLQTQTGATKPLITAPLGANQDSAPVSDAS
jgi:hypothetical protein